MLYIEFKEGQGLGNQMWNYATLRSIAKYKELNYRVFNFDKFKGKNFIKIKESNTKEYIQKEQLNKFNEKCFFDNDLKCFVYGYDKEILNVKENTLIEGVFQSEKYLIPNEKIINDFFKVDLKSNLSINDLDKTCILNLRGGEYKLHKDLILPKFYWINAMANMKKKFRNLEFKIVTDDIDYAENLLPNIEIIKGDIRSDFINLYFSKYLILSNSTFSYFPIKLGEKPNYVIAPFNWSRFDNKYKRWISHANCYSDWHWQNKNGLIMDNEEINLSVKITEDYYDKFNVLVSNKYFEKFNIKNLLSPKIKIKIKKFLGKIFPLLIG